MSDIPNTMWDPLIQNGEVTLEQGGGGCRTIELRKAK